MRRLSLAVAFVLILLVLSSCGGSRIPESSLTIRDATNNLLLSTPDVMGTLTINVGDLRQIQVMRTYRTSGGNTLTDDVTQFTNFKWETDSGSASINQLGNLQGLSPGTQILEAKFRNSTFDPWDHCRLTIEVN